MDIKYLILVINPGSTSTKIALFDNERCIASENLSHSVEEIKKFKSIYEQKEMRTEEEFVLSNLGYVREDQPYNE